MYYQISFDQMTQLNSGAKDLNYDSYNLRNNQSACAFTYKGPKAIHIDQEGKLVEG